MNDSSVAAGVAAAAVAAESTETTENKCDQAPTSDLDEVILSDEDQDNERAHDGAGSGAVPFAAENEPSAKSPVPYVATSNAPSGHIGAPSVNIPVAGQTLISAFVSSTVPLELKSSPVEVNASNATGSASAINAIGLAIPHTE